MNKINDMAREVVSAVYCDLGVALLEEYVEEALREDGVLPTMGELMLLVNGDEHGYVPDDLVQRYSALLDLIEKECA